MLGNGSSFYSIGQLGHVSIYKMMRVSTIIPSIKSGSVLGIMGICVIRISVIHLCSPINLGWKYSSLS